MGDWLANLLGFGGLGADIGSRLAADEDAFSLLRLRNRPELAKDQAFQDFIAPFQHQQQMREMASVDPVGATAYGMMIPAYTAVKAMSPDAAKAATLNTDAAVGSRSYLDSILRSSLGFAQGLGIL